MALHNIRDLVTVCYYGRFHSASPKNEEGRPVKCRGLTIRKPDVGSSTGLSSIDGGTGRAYARIPGAVRHGWARQGWAGAVWRGVARRVRARQGLKGEATFLGSFPFFPPLD